MATLHVRFAEVPPRGRFELVNEEGTPLGEMTFSRAGPDLVIVDHTAVDDSLRGQGGGRRLFDAMVVWARQTGTRVTATCPFARSMFDRVPESRDVLA